MQFDDGNEEVFNVEKIEPILKAVVDGVLKDAVYDDKMVAQWVDRINDGCMKELIELNLPFKYAGRWYLELEPTASVRACVGARVTPEGNSESTLPRSLSLIS